MKILVAGGAGFIGKRLSTNLLEDGHNVHICDNFSTGNLPAIQAFEQNPKFSWAPADICDTSSLIYRPRGEARIYNLACRASPKYYLADPIATMMASTIGMRNLLEIACANGTRILQTSTSEVYGDPVVHPQREEYWGNVNPVGPRSCYDEGKRAAETLCHDYARMRGADVRVARLFNTYGPGMHPDDGRVVSNFVVQALRGEPLTIYGDGSQTRSFCYVDDMVDGLIRLMESDVQGPVNLGNPVEVTMLDLAEMVLRLTGSSSRLSIHPLPQDDPSRRRPDIGRAAAELSWHPRIGLVEGLERTIRYFRETL